MQYFKEKEFTMGGEPCFDKMNPVLLKELDCLREYVGKSFIITSSYRDKEYNKKVNGHKNSQHILGNAVDLSTEHFKGKHKARLVSMALNSGLSVGVSKNFIHIDCRNTGSVVWGY